MQPALAADEGEPWLTCGRCEFPLVAQAELIEEKFETWEKVTWAYELQVLDREATWCYSATNAHDHRFDVVRTLPTVARRSINCRGKPTPEHSWFPGYSWSMAHCLQCNQHLGWGFSPDEIESTRPATVGSPDRSAEKESVAVETSDGDVHVSDETATTTGSRLANTAESTPTDDLGSSRRAEHGSEMGDGAPEADNLDSTATAHMDTAGEHDDANSENSNDGDDSMEPDGEGIAPNELARVVFFGLVLTKMREKALTAEELDQRFKMLKEMQERRRAQEALLLRLMRIFRRARPGVDVQPFWSTAQLAFANSQLDEQLAARIEHEFRAIEVADAEVPVTEGSLVQPPDTPSHTDVDGSGEVPANNAEHTAAGSLLAPNGNASA